MSTNSGHEFMRVQDASGVRANTQREVAEGETDRAATAMAGVSTNKVVAKIVGGVGRMGGVSRVDPADLAAAVARAGEAVAPKGLAVSTNSEKDAELLALFDAAYLKFCETYEYAEGYHDPATIEGIRAVAAAVWDDGYGPFRQQFPGRKNPYANALVADERTKK